MINGADMRTENLCKTDIEDSVLAYFILDNQELHLYEPKIDLFTGERATVYQTVSELILEGTEADMVTICDKLRGKVIPSVIVRIVDSPISINIEYHLKALDDARIRREMAQSYSRGISMCEEGKAPDEIETTVRDGIIRTEKAEVKNIEDVALTVIDDIAAEAEGRKEMGIRCGIHPIDKSTGGFEGSEFIVIAARPGIGKTSLAMNMVRNFAEFNRPGQIFSLEMGADQLVRRMACDIGSIDSELLFKGGLRELCDEDRKKHNEDDKEYGKIIEKVNRVIGRISRLPIYIDDSANLTIDQIYGRAKKAKNLHNIEYVVIDHLGLINGWTTQGQTDKNNITRMIKVMAKDLNVPVFVLSQMNREIEKRAEKIPVMADLRDSGSIEQDADIVMFPVVPGELGITHGDEGYQALIMMGKNRRGAKGPVNNLWWQGHYYRYSYKPGFV